MNLSIWKELSPDFLNFLSISLLLDQSHGLSKLGCDGRARHFEIVHYHHEQNLDHLISVLFDEAFERDMWRWPAEILTKVHLAIPLFFPLRGLLIRRHSRRSVRSWRMLWVVFAFYICLNLRHASLLIKRTHLTAFVTFLIEHHEANEALCVHQWGIHLLVKLLEACYSRARGNYLVSPEVHLGLIRSNWQLFKVLVKLLLQVLLLHLHLSLIAQDEFKSDFLHVFFAVL